MSKETFPQSIDEVYERQIADMQKRIDNENKKRNPSSFELSNLLNKQDMLEAEQKKAYNKMINGE